MTVPRFLALMTVTSLTFPSSLVGQDEAAVRDAVLRHYTAINAGELNAIIQHHTERFTGFLSDNGLLVDLPSRRHQQEAWGPLVAAGWKWNVDIRHLQVTMRGNAAVATFYAIGTITFPGQPPEARTWRISEVWVNERGQWLELHHHDSPLVASP